MAQSRGPGVNCNASTDTTTDMKDSQQPSYVPHGWPRIATRIVAPDAQALVAFIKHVFDASGEYHGTRPAELWIGGSVLMVSDAGERDAFAAFLYVYVEDADATYRRAIAAGAVSIESPALMPYGDRRAMIEDRWGNTWQIATHRSAR